MQNGVRWFESIRHRSLGGGEAGGRREAVAAGVIAVHVEVFKVFFLDRVLQRFAEPIAGAFCGVHGEFFPVSVTEFNSGVVEQIFKVFSRTRFNSVSWSRTSKPQSYVGLVSVPVVYGGISKNSTFFQSEGARAVRT